jgi:hypothetical protein
VFLFAFMIAGHDRMAAAVSTQTAATIIHGIYWVLPKSYELLRSTFGLVSGGEIVGRFGSINTLAVYGSSFLFGALSLGLASWLFSRKDF